MQDRKLVSVAEIVDDDTGMWAGDITTFWLHGDLDGFLQRKGKAGYRALRADLKYLLKETKRRWKRVRRLRGS